MPTYYSRLTSVQLAVADLRDTTTIKPESRPHPAVYDEITSCAAKFARASINGTLDETPILTEDANRSHMRFLGKPPNMPFLMVRVGEAFDDLEVEGKRTRRPARVPPSIMNPVSRSQNPTSSQLSAVNHIGEAGGAKKPVGCENDYGRILRQTRPPTTLPPSIIPRALFLSVFLSKASFLPTYDKYLNKTVFHDVKIDVYFNGELCASAFVSDRFHGDAYEMTEHIIRFSGRRVHRLLEKPWILVPSGQGPDGRPRPNRQNIGSLGDVKQRWVSVSEALMMEAGKFTPGRNGEPSVLGNYLSNLATLEMPAEVEAMQTVGGPKMGIIDVVVTTGKGHKDDANASHLMEPTPIRVREPKASAPVELGNIKDGMGPQDVSITNAVTEDQARAEAQGFPPNLTPDITFTTPTKKRRSLGSRADTEILAQGFTSQPGSSRSQSRLAKDPVSSRNQIKSLSRERAQSNNLHATSLHNNDTLSTRTGSDNPVPSYNNLSNPGQPRDKLQSSITNPFSDVKRPRLVQSQTASSKPSDPRPERFRAPQGTSGRAPEPKSAQSIPSAQKCYKGDSEPPAPSGQSYDRKRRLNWEIVLDNKLTLEEEMRAIAAEAAQTTSKLFTKPPASSRASGVGAGSPAKLNERRSRLRETKDGGKPRNYIEAESDDDDDDGSMNQVANTEKMSKIVRLKFRFPKPPPQPLKSFPPGPELSIYPVFSSSSSPSQPFPIRKSTIAPTTPKPFKPVFEPFTPESSVTRRRLPISPGSLIHTWPGTPPLSDDAVVTYAPGDVLRQVKGERPGSFVEEGVVMGARFLVG